MQIHPRLADPAGRLEVRGNQPVFLASPPPCPAFFRWQLVVTAIHSPGRRLHSQTPLDSAETWLTPLEKRGDYRLSVQWKLTDLFGFTRFVPSTMWTAKGVVEPSALPFTPPAPPHTQKGPWKPRRSGRRTGDPFDVRKYNPGDDLRRIHWPLFAHSRALFVRTADPAPPPSGHQLLLLDTGASSEEELDDRLGRLVSWLHELDQRSIPWTLVVPAAGLSLSQDAGPVLAGLTPKPLTETVEPSWPETLTLITGPQAPIAGFAARLAASRRKLRPVVIPWTPPVTPRRPWWQR